MRKTFCDICGKEIKSASYTIIIEENYDSYEETFNDVCCVCFNKIFVYINSLKGKNYEI